jgi:hypothetical protein
LVKYVKRNFIIWQADKVKLLVSKKEYKKSQKYFIGHPNRMAFFIESSGKCLITTLSTSPISLLLNYW